jgi:hypothetical protein
MRWEEIQSDLRYKLGNLFPQEQSIHTIVRDTDSILEPFINWQGSSMDCWSAVLNEAKKRHLELELVKAARRAYPKDQELQTAESIIIEYQVLHKKYTEERLAQLETIIIQLSISNDQLRNLYQKSISTHWEPPIQQINPKILIQNLFNATSCDEIDPLLEFAERVARHNPNGKAQLRAWINNIPFTSGDVIIQLRKKLNNEKQHFYQHSYVIIKLDTKITGKYRLQGWLFCWDKADALDIEELAPDDDGCTIKTLSGRIEGALQKVEKCLSDRGLDQKSPIIELFLPEKLLNHDINKIMLTFGKEKIPVGRRYPLVIRSLDRINRNNSDWKGMSLRKWRHKWDQFREGDVDIQPKYYNEDDCKTQFHEAIEDDICLVFTFIPSATQKSRKSDIFSTIVDEGVPVVLWSRHSVSLSTENEIMQALFSQNRLSMPEMLLAIRKEHRKDDQHLSHYITLLWENPDHLPPDLDTKANAPKKVKE